MKAVSSAYKQGMAGQLRERSYAIVKFYNIDVDAAEDGIWTANGSMPWSTFDTLDLQHEYGPTKVTLEWNRWELGGEQIISDEADDGFISDKLSDRNGAFASPCVMTRTFSEIHSFPGLTITFDTRMEEWPISVTAAFYLNNTLVQSFTEKVTDSVLEMETNVDDANKIILTFDMALPYRRPRVEYIMYGVGRTYTNNELESVIQSNDVDPLSRRLPDEYFSFTILDYDHLYDPDNPEGIYRFVEINSPVYVQYGYTLADGTIEWIKADHYLLDAQPEVFNNRATFTATGLIGSMSGVFYKSKLGRKSFYDMAEEVLLDADLPLTPKGKHPWVIDESLTAMYTNAVLPIDTHMNCLQLIAHACRCCLYTDDDNIIHIEPFGVTVEGIFSGAFSDNGHVWYSEWDSVNLGTSAQDTYVTLEWNRWELGSNQIICPEIPQPTGYVSNQISGADGMFMDGVDDSFYIDESGNLFLNQVGDADFYLKDGDLIYTGSSAGLYIGDDGYLYEKGVTEDEPMFTRTFDVRSDLPVVGIAFDPVLDEHPLEVEIRYYRGEELIATETASVDETSYIVYSSEAVLCSKIEVTCKRTLPFYRFRVNKVYYRQTDFSLTFDNMDLGTQRISKIDKLKDVSVAKTIYTPNERTTRLYQATTDEEELHIEFPSIAENIQVDLSVGNIELITAYGRAVDLKVSPGMKTITITGNTITASTAVKTYEVSNKGETDVEENPLITDDEMRDSLAKHVSAYLQMRNTYDVEYRGNPELETRDIIGYQTAYTDEFYALVLTDEITFSGALHGAVKVKGLLNTEAYDSVRIVVTVNPRGAGEVSGSGIYALGDSVTLTATAFEDYEFAYWMENGEIVSRSETFNFIASADRRFTAVFTALGRVTIYLYSNPEGAGILTGDGAYDLGDKITISATPTGGYRFISWSEDGVPVTTNTSYSFTAERSRTFTAIFQGSYHTVTVTAGEGGTVSGGGKYLETSSVTVTAKPRSGYAFVKWTENGVTVSQDAEYTFQLMKDRNLTAVFELAYTVTVRVSGNGTATGGGSYYAGATATLTAEPEPGNDFVGWQVDGKIVETNLVYTFTVKESKTYTAVFTEHIPDVIYDREINLIYARANMSATSIGDYALFGGGQLGSSSGSWNAVPFVEAINASLTRSDVSGLESDRYELAAASSPDYAMFAGGRGNGTTWSYYRSSVYAYNASLTKEVATSLLYGTRRLAGASIGNYALFSGGAGYKTTGIADESVFATVYAYDTTLTRSYPTALGGGRFIHSGTQNDNYAIFGGGSNGSSAQTAVYAYDSSLTRSTPTSLSAARSYMAGAGNGEYAFFAGGTSSTGTNPVKAEVDAYSKTLTRQTPTQLMYARYNFSGTRLGPHAVFAGGYDNSTYYATVESYNQSLVKSTPKELSRARRNLAAATVGDKALFAGGAAYSTQYYTTVDAYTLE